METEYNKKEYSPVVYKVHGKVLPDTWPLKQRSTSQGQSTRKSDVLQYRNFIESLTDELREKMWSNREMHFVALHQQQSKPTERYVNDVTCIVFDIRDILNHIFTSIVFVSCLTSFSVYYYVIDS